MPYFIFQWTDEIEAHIAQHGVSMDEFEEVVMNPEDVRPTRGSASRLIAFGETSTGKYLGCVYRLLDEATVYPLTAFELRR